MLTVDFIVQKCSSVGVTHVFCVTGGYAQGLIRAFGESCMRITYCQTEMEASYAALGYSKYSGRPCVVLVTAGCAATNCVTGCMDAHQDSVPLIFISGQVNANLLPYSAHARNAAGAWCNIKEIVKPITLAACEIRHPENAPRNISKTLDRIVYDPLNPTRLGPVWLSVCLDMQQTHIDEYRVHESPLQYRMLNLGRMDIPLGERPVFIVGNGCRRVRDLRANLERIGIPCVFTFLGIDLLPCDHPLYAGRPGVVGDRCGNFVLANATTIIAIGTSLTGSITGYNRAWFARDAKVFKLCIDDSDSTCPKTIRLNWDCETWLRQQSAWEGNTAWTDACRRWKKMWFRLKPDNAGANHVYSVIRTLFDTHPTAAFVHASGSTFNAAWHMAGSQRFVSSTQGDMGSELPMAIGCALAREEDGNDDNVVCLVGDGSFVFGMTALETITRLQLRILIVILNNKGLQSIVGSQTKAFGKTYGCELGTEYSQPNLDKIIEAFRCRRYESETNWNLPAVQEADLLPADRYPCLAVSYDADHRPSALPMEDMSPLLSLKLLEKEMFIPLLGVSVVACRTL